MLLNSLGIDEDYYTNDYPEEEVSDNEEEIEAGMQTSSAMFSMWLTLPQLGDHGDTRSIVSVLIPIDVMPLSA